MSGIESIWPQDVIKGAKAAWATRQSNYVLLKIRNPSVSPLKEWADIPEDTKLWMCAEANAVIRSLGGGEPARYWDEETKTFTDEKRPTPTSQEPTT